MRPLIDGHLDLAWNALSWRRDLRLPLDALNAKEAHLRDELARGHATVSLPELRRGGVKLVLGTLFARVRPDPAPSEVPLSEDPLDGACHLSTHAVAQGQLAYYRQLEAVGEIQRIESRHQLETFWANPSPAADSKIGLVLAMEGADPILHPDQTAEWFGDGLRVTSLVHYGSNRYAAGTGDDGPVTALGRELLRAFDAVGMILDLTHLSDSSFFDALDHFSGPVLASHQNCRSLVPGERQFTDAQIRLVIERGGVIGVAADAWMLHPEWERRTRTTPGSDRDCVSLEAMADQIDHVCQLAGKVAHAAIGSDLDGGFGNDRTPTGLDAIGDLQEIDGILASRGYSETDRDAVFHGNWRTFLARHLPA